MKLPAPRSSLFPFFFRLSPFAFLLFTLLGCAQQPTPRFTAPATAPTQHAVDQANAAATSAQAHNAQASSLANRIDAKDRIIEEWHRQHP